LHAHGDRIHVLRLCRRVLGVYVLGLRLRLCDDGFCLWNLCRKLLKFWRVALCERCLHADRDQLHVLRLRHRIFGVYLLGLRLGLCRGCYRWDMCQQLPGFQLVALCVLYFYRDQLHVLRLRRRVLGVYVLGLRLGLFRRLRFYGWDMCQQLLLE
jgi:hypothetical protein